MKCVRLHLPSLIGVTVSMFTVSRVPIFTIGTLKFFTLDATITSCSPSSHKTSSAQSNGLNMLRSLAHFTDELPSHKDPLIKTSHIQFLHSLSMFPFHKPLTIQLFCLLFEWLVNYLFLITCHSSHPFWYYHQPCVYGLDGSIHSWYLHAS